MLGEERATVSTTCSTDNRQLRHLEIGNAENQDMEENETWKLTWCLPLPLGPSKKLWNRLPISCLCFDTDFDCVTMELCNLMYRNLVQ